MQNGRGEVSPAQLTGLAQATVSRGPQQRHSEGAPTTPKTRRHLKALDPDAPAPTPQGAASAACVPTSSHHTGVIELLDSESEDERAPTAASQECAPATPKIRRRLRALDPDAPGSAPQGAASACMQTSSHHTGVVELLDSESEDERAPTAASYDALCAGPSNAPVPVPPPNASWKPPLLSQQALLDSATLAHVRVPPLPHGYRFSQLYEIIVMIDSREQFTRVPELHGRAALDSHVQRLMSEAPGLTVEVHNLEIADMAIVARCKEQVPAGPAIGEKYMLDWIVERKGVGDLVKSVKDGRYRRQKIQMQRCGLRHLIYLVEGSLDGLGHDGKAAKTAAVRTELWAGFTVLRTADVIDTLRLYARIVKHINALFAQLKAGHTNKAGVGDLPTFTEFIAKARSDKKMTVGDAWKLMLCSVPEKRSVGVGAETAEAVARAYPVPVRLFRALESCHGEAHATHQDTTAACVKLLADLPVALTRKVGPSVAKSIYTEMFQADWHTALP